MNSSEGPQDSFQRIAALPNEGYEEYVEEYVNLYQGLGENQDYDYTYTTSQNELPFNVLQAGLDDEQVATAGSTSGSSTSNTQEGSVDINKDTEDDPHIIERKRAQNRAAQRAFRKRRDARLKELEQKLQESEEDRKSLSDKIRWLKKQNLEINAENKFLMQAGNSPSFNTSARQVYLFPSRTEFFESLVDEKHKNHALSHNQAKYLDNSGKEVLTISAAWEYLHSLSAHKDFDIYMVMQSLKGSEVCHGHGAAYPKALIDQAVDNAGQND